jgi:heat shock protein HtpX
MASFFTEIRQNKLKSNVIILFFFLFVLGIGAFIGYFWLGQAAGSYAGIVMALIVGSIYFLISWFAGNQIILSTTGAKPATKKEYPYLYNSVEALSIAAGIPAPKVYVIDDSALNAFATGRDPKNSAIVVTTGLLKTMNRQELEGVLAHEMSHIKNYDIRVMMLTAVLVGVLTLLSDIMLRSVLWGRRDREGGNIQIVMLVVGIALVVLSPLIGYLIQLAVSRRREYLADASGAMLTRYPPGLASALKKIAKDPDPLVDNANRATAHLFISTPFRKRGGFFTGLFSTHPPIEERIKKLESM